MQPDPTELENTSLWYLASWNIGHSAADAVGENFLTPAGRTNQRSLASNIRFLLSREHVWTTRTENKEAASA